MEFINHFHLTIITILDVKTFDSTCLGNHFSPFARPSLTQKTASAQYRFGPSK
jgi:hypothetical protein